MRVTAGDVTAPWELPEFSTPPPTGGKDRWESSWIQRGWLVSVHRGQRKRSFQPIHRASPVAGGDLLPLRVTVGFEEDTNRRFVKTDCWDVEPANPVASRWTGWTFFRLKHVDGTAHDRAVSQGSGGDARAEGHRSPLPERDGAGVPHDRGALQREVLRLPDGAEGLRGLLPDLPGEEAVGGRRAAQAKSYAPLPTPRAPTARPKAQTSAGRRAQPVLADLQLRDGLPPAEEELSADGSWSEVSGETW